MKVVQCKNGHYYDGDKYASCPHCKKETFVWEDGMNPAYITGFEISFGDYPIRKFRYDGLTLYYKNQINFIRDGGWAYPDGFLDEHAKVLTQGQRDSLSSMLKKIPFKIWVTDPQVFEQMAHTGYYQNNTFRCTVFGEKDFVCYPSNGAEPVGFHELSEFLRGVK